jgi:hydrogenase maturation protease
VNRPDVLVIGYGNSIKGDDALGHVVAAEIERRLTDDAVRVVTAEILTTDLLPDVAAAQLVIFLDASCAGAVGRVECRPVQPDCTSAASMAHTLSVGALLGFVQQFYGRAPNSYLITSPAADFELRDARLSPAVQAVVPEMAARAIELIHLGGVSSARRLQDTAATL